MNPQISRRTFLRSSGVALALPFLDSMLPKRGLGADANVKGVVPRRMVCICTNYGLYGPALFPENTGRNYTLSPYLEILKEHRNDFTLFSGISHPNQAGACGHSSEMTWLTSAANPGLSGFRNTISVDQLVAEKTGFETRYPSLVLGTGSAGINSISYTRSGVMIPAESKPSKVFAKLFLNGTPDEIKGQMQKLQEGRSIMDSVQGQAKTFGRRVGTADRAKLDEYYTSVREMELRFAKAEEWVKKTKPTVDAAQPKDITDERDLIGRLRLLLDLVPLAVQTDSTRLFTIMVQGLPSAPLVPGVSIDHHGLSHHGKEPGKVEQLRRIEEAQFAAVRDLIAALAKKEEAGRRLLDSTMVMFGSNLGNANSHEPTNLNIVLAGGGFKHAGHVAFDQKNNTPLSNLFVTMLQRMNIETDRFGSSKGTVSLG
ncbi:MAG: DUF1552 domain-containing protein [Chthoniobacterales bacterium]|nr:DUF1552 domain-containing protein [Chthoniobacterales bacterium]